MRFTLRYALVLPSLAVLLAPCTYAQTSNACQDLPTKQAKCSASGINRSCDLYIDRLRPVAPPSIFLRRGDTVTVHIINPSPFETLSLDFKTAGDTTPPDPFANGFTALSGSITKPVFVDLVSFVGFDEKGIQIPDPFAAKRAQLKLVADRQRILFSEYDSSIVINEIFLTTQTPPANACTAALTWDDKGYPNPWVSPLTWAGAVINVLNALQADSLAPDSLKGRVTQLDADLAALAADPPTGAKPEDLEKWTIAIDAITRRQTKLDELSADPPSAPTPPSFDADKALIKAITNLHLENFKSKERKRTILDLSPSDHNVTAEVWSLDYVNNAQIPTKNAVSGTIAKATDVLNAAPSLTAIASVNVTYEQAQRLEFATGVMTPFHSYHSYSAAEAASSGTVTGTVIQETKSYTVLPMALTNIVLAQGIVKGTPLAGFFTIGVGYNPVTSSIEFGVGPSFSYRSIIVSGFADIGQDTHLADGFTVGQSLPSTNTKPLTSNYWFVRPAFGLSVRIPIGGGSSSPASGAASSSAASGKH